MTDVKVSDMPPDAAPTLDDILMTIDQAGTPANKQVTVSDLIALISANLASGSIDLDAIDWSTAGGIWWEELKRVTLGATASIMTLSSFTPKNHMIMIGRGIASGGVIDSNFTFNNDTGANYAYRHAVNNGANVDSASNVAIGAESGQTDSGSMTFVIMEIANYSSEEKNFFLRNVSQDATGGANLPTNMYVQGKWANASAQISEIDWTETGAGSFDVGSELILIGHD